VNLQPPISKLEDAEDRPHSSWPKTCLSFYFFLYLTMPSCFMCSSCIFCLLVLIKFCFIHVRCIHSSINRTEDSILSVIAEIPFCFIIWYQSLLDQRLPSFLILLLTMSIVTPPSTTSDTQPPPPSSALPSLPNLSKLTHDNYPIWYTIIIPFLESQNLYGYVSGDLTPPPKFIASPSSTSTSAATVVNPVYSMWYQQDKLVLTALISSLSKNILVHVYGLNTSRAVWLALEKCLLLNPRLMSCNLVSNLPP
jgi:hypothetical protein